MNSDPSDDARLEALLRQGLGSPVPDNGFTQRVLAALPPPRTRARIDWAHTAVVAVGTMAGLAFVGWQGSWSGFAPALAQTEQAVLDLSDQLSDPALSVVLALTLGLVVLMLMPEDASDMQA